MSKIQLSALALFVAFICASCTSSKRAYIPGANNYSKEPSAVNPVNTQPIPHSPDIIIEDNEGGFTSGKLGPNGEMLVPEDGPGTPVDHPFVNPVYFAYDSAVVGQAYDDLLKSLAQFISSNPTYHLTINGHCDERGSEEYNRALSEKRALAVKQAIISYGAPADRLNTVGFGEEKPADSSKNPTAYAKNRRANFDVFAK